MPSTVIDSCSADSCSDYSGAVASLPCPGVVVWDHLESALLCCFPPELCSQFDNAVVVFLLLLFARLGSLLLLQVGSEALVQTYNSTGPFSMLPDSADDKDSNVQDATV